MARQSKKIGGISGLLVVVLALAALALPAYAAERHYETDDRGFVPYWLGLGPIAVTKQEAEKTAIDKDFLGKDAAVTPTVGDKVTVEGKDFTWRCVTVAKRTPIVQCDEAIGKLENAVGYLVSYVDLPTDQQVTLKWGSDDSGVLFVNGKEVDRFAKGRNVDIDQNTSGPVEFKAGVNTIVLKLVNRVSSWGGCVRLVRADGKPLAHAWIKPAPAGKVPPAVELWPIVPTTYNFEARTYKSAEGKVLLYELMKPENYDATRKYPLVLYLHGAGERGSDNKKQLVWLTEQGNNQLVSDQMITQHPCFIVAPQCPEKGRWEASPWDAVKSTMAEKPTEQMQLVLELMDTLPKEFSLDSSRLYVTGMSMGGYGTWDIISRRPEMFAAAMPVCGGGDEAKAPLLAKLPIWAFHGEQDPAVKVIRSRHMIEALKKAGGTPKYTEYAGQGHFVWVPAHGDIATWEWLFAQHR